VERGWRFSGGSGRDIAPQRTSSAEAALQPDSGGQPCDAKCRRADNLLISEGGAISTGKHPRLEGLQILLTWVFGD
jgi:hypothetical protein